MRSSGFRNGWISVDESQVYTGDVPFGFTARTVFEGGPGDLIVQRLERCVAVEPPSSAVPHPGGLKPGREEPNRVEAAPAVVSGDEAESEPGEIVAFRSDNVAVKHAPLRVSDKLSDEPVRILELEPVDGIVFTDENPIERPFLILVVQHPFRVIDGHRFSFFSRECMVCNGSHRDGFQVGMHPGGIRSGVRMTVRRQHAAQNGHTAHDLIGELKGLTGYDHVASMIDFRLPVSFYRVLGLFELHVRIVRIVPVDQLSIGVRRKGPPDVQCFSSNRPLR